MVYANFYRNLVG